MRVVYIGATIRYITSIYSHTKNATPPPLFLPILILYHVGSVWYPSMGDIPTLPNYFLMQIIMGV